LVTSKVASFVWRGEEAWENRVLEFAGEGIVACFSRFRMRRHTLSGSAGAHRRVELECWLRSVNKVAPFSCSATDLQCSELLDQDHRAPAVGTQPGSGQPGLAGGGCAEILTRAGLQQLLAQRQP
jgi:hypothetical protein